MVTASISIDCVTDPDHLRSYLIRARGLGEVTFDTETTGVLPFEGDRICSFSLYHPELDSIFVPVRQRGLFVENMPEDGIRHLQLLCEGDVEVSGHNLTHDINFVRVEGIKVDDLHLFDTMYNSFLWNDSLPSYKLKGHDSVTETILGDFEDALELDELEHWKETHPKATYDYCPIEIICPYAKKDCIRAWRLKEFLKPALQGRKDPYPKLLQDNVQWVKLVTTMGSNGLLFDFDRAAEIEKSHRARMMEIQMRLSQELWPKFNPNSSKNVMTLMRQNDIDAPDTEKGTLWLYVNKLPVLRDVLTFRALDKVLSSYINPWRKQAHAGGGRVYASWGATGHGYGDDYGQARTGRLRARHPNLMGVPTYDSDIHREKECFEATPGYVYGAIDLSQADIRLATHYTQDERLIQILCDPDGDIHEEVAKELGMPRIRAKRIVFGGGLYGGGAKRIAETMTDELHEYISDLEAAKWLKAFQNRYPRFKFTHKQVEKVGSQRGFIFLWNNRMIHLGPNEDAHKLWHWLVQGGVAAIVQDWMLKIDNKLQAVKSKARFILQVHDEVVLEIPKEEVDILPELARLVEGIGPEGGWRCPIFTKIKTGERWSDL